MLVFGGQRRADFAPERSPVYISHLPMFMPPHDFQVILRVTGGAASRYRDFVAHFGDFEVYTFRPEPFSIDELAPRAGAPQRASFGGTLFRGHFERGGTEIAGDVAFEVEQTVHFRRFAEDAGNASRRELRYLCFGQRHFLFLAHLITAAPDFDQIVAADLSSLSGVSEDELPAGVLATVPGRADTAETRLKEGETLSGPVQAQASGAPGWVECTLTHEIYLETGEPATAR